MSLIINITESIHTAMNLIINITESIHCHEFDYKYYRVSPAMSLIINITEYPQLTDSLSLLILWLRLWGKLRNILYKKIFGLFIRIIFLQFLVCLTIKVIYKYHIYFQPWLKYTGFILRGGGSCKIHGKKRKFY